MISRRSILAAAAASALPARGHMQKDRKKLKLAFVGTGHRAWGHIQVLKAIPDFEIGALADPTPKFRDRAVSLVATAVRTYSGHQDMLEKEKDLDGVVVVTPTFLHAEPAIAALSAGHHVLCEKPMALNVDQANQMIAAAKKTGKVLQIDLQMRYDPLYEKMAELVHSGQIGPLQYVNGTLFRKDWNPESWKYTDPRTGVATNWRYLSRTAGSSLMEDGIHELDVLNWMIANPIARVYATGGNNIFKNRETIDHAGLAIDYEDGTKLTFDFSIFCPNAGTAARRMTLIGSRGNIQTGMHNLTLRNKDGASQDIQIAREIPHAASSSQAGADQDIGTYREYLAFANSIRTGAEPFCDGETAKQVLKIALLAEKSIRQRRIVTWNELPA